MDYVIKITTAALVLVFFPGFVIFKCLKKSQNGNIFSFKKLFEKRTKVLQQEDTKIVEHGASKKEKMIAESISLRKQAVRPNETPEKNSVKELKNEENKLTAQNGEKKNQTKFKVIEDDTLDNIPSLKLDGNDSSKSK